jgi:hypothetical protein
MLNDVYTGQSCNYKMIFQQIIARLNNRPYNFIINFNHAG